MRSNSKTFIALLYQIFLLGFFATLYTGSLFSKKIRLFLKSRKEGYHTLCKIIHDSPKKKKSHLIWLHAASAGEAQQANDLAKVLSERLQTPHPFKIILSITSLSVKLPIKKNYLLQKEFFSHIFYLPVDFLWNWWRLFDKNPPIACFVTFTWDLWPNLLASLKKNGTRLYLCSAAFDLKSWKHRLTLGKAWGEYQYGLLDGVSAVSHEDAKLAKRLVHPRVSVRVGGDSRYGAILEKATEVSEPIEIASFQRKRKKVLFFASTYAADEKKFIPILGKLLQDFSDLSIFIFPHHIDHDRLQEVRTALSEAGLASTLWSESLAREKSQPKIILVDQLGILAQAYRHCSLCYVGGGFHHRIHNVAEPAVYGKMVLSGPRISSSPIAREMHRAGFLTICLNQQHLYAHFGKLLNNMKKVRRACQTIKKLISKKPNASKYFLDTFLTNDLKKY